MSRMRQHKEQPWKQQSFPSAFSLFFASVIPKLLLHFREFELKHSYIALSIIVPSSKSFYVTITDRTIDASLSNKTPLSMVLRGSKSNHVTII